MTHRVQVGRGSAGRRPIERSGWHPWRTSTLSLAAPMLALSRHRGSIRQLFRQRMRAPAAHEFVRKYLHLVDTARST